MVRFIHAADLHLDSPFSGLKHLPEKIWHAIRESTFSSLHTLVSYAITHEVDFILFSGDIYDVEDRSIKAQAQLKKEMERLENVGISVFIIHGNHDFQADTSLHLSMPSNVTVFGTSVETKQLRTNSGKKVALSGFSYESRWIYERMIENYPTRLNDVDFHIGLLHGFQEGAKREHGKYAPFSMQELRVKQYDYWALGHIHKREKISDHPLAYYPGNIQGRHKNESGEKGFSVVELSSHKHQITFIPSAPIIWETIDVNLSEAQSIDDVYNTIQEALVKLSEMSYLMTIRFHSSEHLSEEIRRKMIQLDFIEALQIVEEDRFVWIVDLSFALEESKKSIPALEKLFPQAWSETISSIKNEEVFNHLTNEFFHQTKQASLLLDRTELYREKIVESALLKLSHLMENEGDFLDEN